MQPNPSQESRAFEGAANPQYNTRSVTGTDDSHFLNIEKQEFERVMMKGANWFYWIAALSLVNSVIALFNGNWSFLAGLGITQVIDAIAIQVSAGGGSGANVIALMMDIIVAAFFAFFGFMAGKRQGRAFITGIVLYFLDGLIFLLVQGWLSIAFHLFALYFIFLGWRALNNLRRLEQTGNRA
jgi:hypothetical protein